MKIYLAGPDVFRKNAVEYGLDLKATCAIHGFEGLFPLDNEVDQSLPKSVMSEVIYKANVKMIKSADLILANLDPFRGPSVDPGTAFEIGMGVALGKPVIGYYTGRDPGEYKDRVLPVFDVFSKQYSEVEDFGLRDNLMIDWGCDNIFPSFESALNAIIRMS